MVFQCAQSDILLKNVFFQKDPWKIDGKLANVLFKYTWKISKKIFHTANTWIIMKLQTRNFVTLSAKIGSPFFLFFDIIYSIMFDAIAKRCWHFTTYLKWSNSTSLQFLTLFFFSSLFCPSLRWKLHYLRGGIVVLSTSLNLLSQIDCCYDILSWFFCFTYSRWHFFF